MNTLNRCIAHVLIVCTIGLGMPPAWAGMITTEQIYSSAERDRVKNFLDRADVRAQMQALGVDAAAARERVDALTDREIDELAGRIDQLPAGGSDVLGVLLAVFIILLITDILGLTKIFPFTRPIR